VKRKSFARETHEKARIFKPLEATVSVIRSIRFPFAVFRGQKKNVLSYSLIYGREIE